MVRVVVVSVAFTVGLVSCSEDSPLQQDAGQVQDSPAPEERSAIVYETDFSSPEGGLFGGSPSFSQELPTGVSFGGEYTSYGALSLNVDLPAGNEQYDFQSIASTEGVFAGDRELVDLSDVSIQAYGTPLEWETGIAYGLHCRQQTGEPGHFYEASIGLDEFSNEATIYRANGAEGLELLASAALPPSVKTASREWNLLQMDCVGDSISLSLNGEEILSATDTTYASGMVAMFTAAYVPREMGEKHPGASAVADFDELRITEL